MCPSAIAEDDEEIFPPVVRSLSKISMKGDSAAEEESRFAICGTNTFYAAVAQVNKFTAKRGTLTGT